MNSISTKLALFFNAVILIATGLSFVTVSLLSRQVADEIVMDHREMVESILTLRDRTALNLDDIVAIVSTPNYMVRRIELLDAADLGGPALERLEQGEVLVLDRGRLHGVTTVLRLGEAYISISLQPQRSVLQIWFSRLWTLIVLYLVLAGGLIIALTRRVVRPVLELTEATQQVAKGNFGVHIESGRKDEIGRLTANFNHMVGELRTIDYLRRDFISNVSHEIKTPLASIHGYARLLQHESLSREERAEYSTIIADEAMRLSSLASTMLRLSRLESQEKVEDTTRYRLDEQLRRTIVLLEPQWRHKEIAFELDLQPVEYVANEELMCQVWSNLLGNAIKFSHQAGRVDVSLRETAGEAVVSVRDHGIGIAEGDIAHVFEKFFQVDRAHSGEGSGLGLSLVRRIIDLQGGRIDVQSSVGQGSTFIVTLPNRHAEEGKTARASGGTTR